MNVRFKININEIRFKFPWFIGEFIRFVEVFVYRFGQDSAKSVVLGKFWCRLVCKFDRNQSHLI